MSNEQRRKIGLRTQVAVRSRVPGPHHRQVPPSGSSPPTCPRALSRGLPSRRAERTGVVRFMFGHLLLHKPPPSRLTPVFGPVTRMAWRASRLLRRIGSCRWVRRNVSRAQRYRSWIPESCFRHGRPINELRGERSVSSNSRPLRRDPRHPVVVPRGSIRVRGVRAHGPVYPGPFAPRRLKGEM
jgi:hypothetical protein